MSWLNPMTYVRGARNVGRAVAGRSYYEPVPEADLSLDEESALTGDVSDRAETYSGTNDGKGGA